ncbi:MAG: hypothetical protein KIT72_09185 [Polyangiaceae bacterium]|nr:hypothetical protein [Polyangiaceae bacterium]MCW5790582.1 hypothetical protein [Polyangiaceae bacterium]
MRSPPKLRPLSVRRWGALCALALTLVGCPEPPRAEPPSGSPTATGRTPDDSHPHDAAPPRSSSASPTRAPHPGGAKPDSRERVRLQARSKLGVPLHPSEGSSAVSGRVPSGAEVRVQRWSADERWLEIEAPSGERGWITARYLAAGRPREVVDSLPDASIWASPAACEAAVTAGDRLAKEPSRLRVGTWNLRWFPTGGPGGRPTHLSWLGCALTWLGVDVLGVQELTRGAESREGRELLASLDRLTGGRWRLRLDDCPSDGRQRVGVLYDERRAQISQVVSAPHLNPHGNACKDRLRPGFTARVKAASGLDFELTVVHLKSGTDARSYGLRRASLTRLGELFQSRTQALGDPDFVLLGDLNSMGCSGCAPKVSHADELGVLTRELAQAGFTLTPAACSHYYQGAPSALDHIATHRSMQEATSPPVSAGVCQVARCGVGLKAPEVAAFTQLSDHCPTLIDLDGRDLD